MVVTTKVDGKKGEGECGGQENNNISHNFAVAAVLINFY